MVLPVMKLIRVHPTRVLIRTVRVVKPVSIATNVVAMPVMSVPALNAWKLMHALKIHVTVTVSAPKLVRVLSRVLAILVSNYKPMVYTALKLMPVYKIRVIQMPCAKRLDRVSLYVRA
jgi:hypothetical protein